MITKDMTLADVVKEHPNTIGFLNLDFFGPFDGHGLTGSVHASVA